MKLKVIGCGYGMLSSSEPFLHDNKGRKGYGKRDQGKDISFFSFHSLTQANVVTTRVNFMEWVGDV